MVIKIGAFEVELHRAGFYVALPKIGEAFWAKGWPLTFNRWGRIAGTEPAAETAGASLRG